MQAELKRFTQLSEDYALVEQALGYLEDHFQDQPNLSALAEQMGYSEYHFQRLFTRWVGISPKRFLQFLTKEHAKAALQDSLPVDQTAYVAGLSSPGRLHDLFVTCEAVTPGEYKARGIGLAIDYGFHPTPFGECLLALTGRGICFLRFVDQGGREAALQDLRTHWQKATLTENPQKTRQMIWDIFQLAERPDTRLHLYLHGTNFQIKVWEALLRIPYGKLVSYSQIAASLNAPGAARAVGQAVGSNPIAYLIPCHRVIRKMGVFGNYRYGPLRKKAMLGWEFSQMAQQADL
ncbi:MAG TPA: bifunctional helix-turn-helix domain-containing protein/methylated-DNA--[protein]-cysteine S-methyltransferase [Anaerolineales bacterium]|nr:bifunctional helix-turn-helix domain-containing protein/methylated-DNA--[protein]-cysteine S-methyltransferase [Anaerolineales bacterium]